MDAIEVDKFKLGRLRLQENASVIVQHVVFEDVIDSLYSNIDNFSANDVEALLDLGDNGKKMRKLLVSLQSNEEEDVYEWFHKALVDVNTIGCDEVASILENTQISDENRSDSNQELLKKEILGVGEYLKEIGDVYKDNEPLEIPYDTNYNSSANLTEDSMKEFVPFVFKKKAKADKFKDIPVYIGLSLINVKPTGMASEYSKYVEAMDALHRRLPGPADDEIKNCIEDLLQHEIKGYEPVVIIAGQMFDECNLGRVVTWFRFWRRFVSSIEDSQESLQIFCKYIGFYLNQLPSYQKWSLNGWDNMVKQANMEVAPVRTFSWAGELFRLLVLLYNYFTNR